MTAPLPSPDQIATGFQLALDAADRFVGATAPNPPVGCALLAADGTVLAVAAHEAAGQPHAEAAALAACRAAGRQGDIHTVVVTLEPCNHYGRTPPCTEAILASPAKAVWYGAGDPNPTATGGAARLAAAGLAIGPIADLAHADAAALHARAARLIAPFVTRLMRGHPWLTIKQALDADGSMIPPPGAKTFTSDASLALAHDLRRRADAVITGSGTILADAPLLTVRRVEDLSRKPRRLAILDRRGRTPAAYLDAARARGFAPSLHGDIPGLLADLAADSVLEALVECGPTLLAAFLEAGLWDEHVIIRQGADGDVVTRALA
ncbi:bifunctional diaminohydroxyphosphoribosylaminopyrimidine deaminase/5-amino-6-(5-phosphoribosylamino)uracil reductase RibD [Caulobacter hibisci]|uniref:Riboflavin biosynthesis protein RibD n=1 Tax=Caulobacter hibisci TaxID=2035993 RepID=A0ABS0T4D4_9CAUL|nr:bifunctional diaminohydroxyphosphoribosylaminopyrimidine deaminase/5-amino-6-(5-phosphoribosylamino)uracil reductase RibD [Caulobacter hibisci]MBI1685753.1 bifunctional diaminohydroxyphosphoribosylaminopyrimidine deaminase/5-amino-6-(5-phosphoribosylamino)uracil reductase RibD [Caulobacter hibisci]